MDIFVRKNPWNDKRFVLFVHVLQRHWSVYLEVDNMATINWLNKQTDPNKIIPRLNIGISFYVPVKRNKVSDFESKKSEKTWSGLWKRGYLIN